MPWPILSWKNFYVWYLAVSIAMPARWPVSFLLALNSSGILWLETPFLNFNFPSTWWGGGNLVFPLEYHVCLFLILLCLSLPGYYVTKSLSSLILQRLLPSLATADIAFMCVLSEWGGVTPTKVSMSQHFTHVANLYIESPWLER